MWEDDYGRYGVVPTMSTMLSTMHAGGSGLYDAANASTELNPHLGYSVSYGYYGDAQLQAKIGRLEVQISRTRNRRRRRRLQRKLARLKARAARAARGVRRGGRRLVRRGQGRVRMPRLFRGFGRGRQARIQARLRRRQLRQQARIERRSARQAARAARQDGYDPMTDTAMLPDSMMQQGYMPEGGAASSMMESGIIEGGALSPGAMDVSADIEEGALDEGPPWGKIALAIGLVVVAGVGIRAATKKRSKPRSSQAPRRPSTTQASRSL